MSFWELSDGNVVQNDASFEMGGDFDVIPKGTQLLAAIEEAKWEEYEGERYINIKWRAVRPELYANRIIFQKIKVLDPKKSDNAKRMLAAIDANAGGKLSKLEGEPTDIDLMKSVCGKVMIIKLAVWKMDDREGNWVQAVMPADTKTQKLKAVANDKNEIPF